MNLPSTFCNLTKSTFALLIGKAFLLFLLFVSSIDAQAQAPNLKFPETNGEVGAIAVDASDNIYIGGVFTAVGGVTRNNLAKILPNGTVDASWAPSVNGYVSVLVLSGTDIFIGGDFTEVNGSARTRLAKIGSNGLLDNTWTPSVGGRPSDMIVSGGFVYICGNFSTVNSVSRFSLARVNSNNGTLDDLWDPSPSNQVEALATLGTDIYVGGFFNTIGGASRNRLARFNSTGSLAAWSPDVDGVVVRTIATSGSDIYVGGNFTEINGVLRSRIAKINTSGVVDPLWNPNANNSVQNIAISGSDIFVSGNFGAIGGQSHSVLAKLRADGTAYELWAPSPNTSGINDLEVFKNNVYVGGSYSSIGGSAQSNFAVLPTTVPFVTTWRANGGSIRIPTTGSGYNYSVFVRNLDNPGTNEPADINITFDTDLVFTTLEAGSRYEVSITGSFPRMACGRTTTADAEKLLSVEEWGDVEWGNMSEMFEGCSNLRFASGVGVPKMTMVEDMSFMFKDATNFDEDIENWDVSGVRDMIAIFEGAISFNENLNDWDVSSVTEMNRMFNGATSFSRALDEWDISSVSSMVDMLNDTDLSVNEFNLTLQGWSTLNMPPESTIPASITLGAEGLSYTDQNAYNVLTNTYSWVINGAGTIRYVNTNVSGGTNDGSSWANAYSDLQGALAVATSGDEIWVAEGTYYPTTTANRGISFDLKDGVALYGGFEGTETLREDRDWAGNPTILSGDIDGNDMLSGTFPSLTFTGFENNSHNILTIELSTDAQNIVVDGFTIQNGNCDGANFPENTGAAILISPTGSSNLIEAKIQNCIFKQNTGGGSAFEISSNDGEVSNIDIENCLFFNNQSSSTPAVSVSGISKTASDLVKIIGCTFSRNKSTNTFSSPGAVSISVNSSTGAIGELFVRNSIFWGNEGGNPDPAVDLMVFQPSAELDIDFSLINSTLIRYPDGAIPGNSIIGTNNINSDPEFGDGNNEDFRLKLGSPAIDEGNNGSATLNKDLANTPRQVGGVVNMGAYEELAIPALIVTLATLAPNVGNIKQGSTGNLVYALSISASEPINLTGLDLVTSGNYNSSDITSFQLVYSPDPALGGDTDLGTVSPSAGSGETLSFSAFGVPVPVNPTTGYLFLLADVPSGATVGRNLIIDAPDFDMDFAFSIPSTGTGSSLTASNTIYIAPALGEEQPLGNNGLYFDGVDDFVNVPDVGVGSSLDLTNQITLMGWVKKENLNGTGDNYRIISKGFSGQGYGMAVNGNGQFLFTIYEQADVFAPGVVVEKNKWVHLAISYNSGVADGLNMYANGALVHTVTSSSVALDNALPLYIGQLDPNNQMWDGQIDEVKIFNTARTQAQIQADMYSSTPNGAVGFWDFNDDLVNNDPITANEPVNPTDHTGTLTNGPLWSYRVTNDSDMGAGSLRQAIAGADLDSDKDYIDFSIPGTGVQNIKPATTFPLINNPIIIDGYSQQGSSVNTADMDSPVNSVINIEIDGSGATSANSILNLGGNDSEVYGLALYGLATGSGIEVDIASNVHIFGNFLGTDASGTRKDVMNRNSIYLDGADNCIVGGLASSERNIIAGIANGIFIFGGANGNALGNEIHGNFIGADKTGSASLFGTTTSGNGIAINGSTNTVQNSTIGGTTLNEENLIFGNAGTGVSIIGAPATGNRILRNRIFGNSGLGIDLGTAGVTENDLTPTFDADLGPNNLQNFPEITTATLDAGNVEIEFRVPSVSLNSAFPISVSFYKSDGNRQGEVFLGTTSVSNESAVSYNYTGVLLSLGDEITAIATDNNGNSSEFSAEVAVVAIDAIFYSKSSGIFDVSGNWSSTTDGTGPEPVAIQFTDGLTDFVIQNTHSITTTSGAIATDNLTIESGGSLDFGDSDFTINGDLVVDGNLLNTSILNNDISVSGDFTVDGNYTGSSTTATLIIGGSITNNGVFDSNAKIIMDGTSLQTILASANIANLTSNLTVTNNTQLNGGTINVGITENGSHTINAILTNNADLIFGLADIEGSGSLVNGTSADLTLQGVDFDPTLTATANNNTVFYNRIGEVQNMISTSYHNLSMSFGETTVPAVANKIMNGNINVLGDLDLLGGTHLNPEAHRITVAGATTVGAFSVFNDYNSGEVNTFTGLVTINADGEFTSIASSHVFTSGITNNGTFNLNTTATISGDLTPNTDMVFGGDVIFGGDLEFIATLGTSGNLSFNADASVNTGRIVTNNMTGVRETLVEGDLHARPNAVFNNGIDANLRLNGGLTSSISSGNPPGMFNFTSNGNTVIFGDNQSVFGNFYNVEIDGNNTQSNNSSTITVNGDFTINAGKSYQSGSNSILNVVGNFVNNGTFNDASNFGTVVFSGTASQQITMANGSFHGFELANSDGAELQGNIRIEGDFALDNGILDLNGNTLSFSETGDNVSISSNASRMILMDNSSSSVIKEFPGSSTATSFLFPIGTAVVANEYSPFLASLTSYTPSGIPQIEVSLEATEADDVATSGQSIERHWTINSENMSAINGTLTFNYVAGDNSGLTDLVGAKYDGTNWLMEGIVDEGTSTISFDYTSTPQTNLDGVYTAGKTEAFGTTPPVASDYSPTPVIDEDNNFSNFDNNNFGFTDADNDDFDGIRITLLPTNGTLSFGSTPTQITTTEIVLSLAQINTLVYEPNNNFFGADNFEFSVFDNTRLESSNEATFNITINAVNDEPTITNQSVLSTNEDTPLTILLNDLTVSDPDNNYPADFTLTVNSGAGYSVSGNIITPDLNFNGTLTIPVFVNDGTANSPTFDLTVTVIPVNDEPTITSQSVLSTNEDTPLAISLNDLTVSDPDNNYPADFTLTVNSGVGYSVLGNTITPDLNFNGTLTVPVFVNDGTANSPTFNLTVIVNAVNDEPIITSQSVLSTNEDTPLTISLNDLTVSDPDNNYPADFTLTVNFGAGYSVSGNTITPDLNFNGTLTVPVFVNDGTANSPIFNLTVIVIPVNDLPEIEDLSITGILELGQQLAGEYEFSDVEDGDFANGAEASSLYQWFRSDDGIVGGDELISGATSRTYTLGATDAGKYLVLQVTAVDKEDGTGNILTAITSEPFNTVLEPDLGALQAIRDTANSNGANIPWGTGTISATDALNFAEVTVVAGRVTSIDLRNFQISNLAENAFGSLNSLVSVDVRNNRLQFSELIATKNELAPSATFLVSPQAKVGADTAIAEMIGRDIVLLAKTTHPDDIVNWFKNGNPLGSGNNLNFSNLAIDNSGTYTYQVSNPNLTDLTLQSNRIELSILPMLHPTDARIIRKFFSTSDGNNWNSSNNWLTNEFEGNWQGIILGSDPTSVGFSRVVSIDLSSNNLTGAIPDSLFLLPQLSSLDLFNNQLSGKIPNSIGSATNLAYLDLDKNKLAGAIPTEIGNLTKLTTLWLARNQFNNIPESIGNLVQLKNLFLQNNLINKIPSRLSLLTALEILDLGNNSLTTANDFAGLTKLKKLQAERKQNHSVCINKRDFEFGSVGTA